MITMNPNFSNVILMIVFITIKYRRLLFLSEMKLSSYLLARHSQTVAALYLLPIFIYHIVILYQ